MPTVSIKTYSFHPSIWPKMIGQYSQDAKAGDLVEVLACRGGDSADESTEKSEDGRAADRLLLFRKKIVLGKRITDQTTGEASADQSNHEAFRPVLLSAPADLHFLEIRAGEPCRLILPFHTKGDGVVIDPDQMSGVLAAVGQPNADA